MKKNIRLSACVLLLCACTAVYAQQNAGDVAETQAIDFTEKADSAFGKEGTGDGAEKAERDFEEAERCDRRGRSLFVQYFYNDV